MNSKGLVELRLSHLDLPLVDRNDRVAHFLWKRCEIELLRSRLRLLEERRSKLTNFIHNGDERWGPGYRWLHEMVCTHGAVPLHRKILEKIEIARREIRIGLANILWRARKASQPIFIADYTPDQSGQFIEVNWAAAEEFVQGMIRPTNTLVFRILPDLDPLRHYPDNKNEVEVSLI